MGEYRVIEVPKFVASELASVLDDIRAAAKEDNPDIADTDIVLEQRETRDMAGGFGGEFMLYLGGLVIANLTEEWVKKVLWPRIEPKIKKYSREVFDLLERAFKSRRTTRSE